MGPPMFSPVEDRGTGGFPNVCVWKPAKFTGLGSWAFGHKCEWGGQMQFFFQSKCIFVDLLNHCRYNLCQPARHLAVALLDFFMDNLDIQTKHLHLVAIGCLLVSCKFEEQEVKIPRASDLNELVHSPGYTNLEYLQVRSIGWPDNGMKL